MKMTSRILVCAAVFASGYMAGTAHLAAPTRLNAQQAEEIFSDDTMVAYFKARKATTDLRDSLTAEGAYVPASDTTNLFAISVGGTDAVKDLEEGRGVDPETFAAIYADRAIPEIAQHLDADNDGRIRYKGTVVRMYSRDKLRELFQRRDRLMLLSERYAGK